MFLASCGASIEETAISNFVQTSGNVKTDMDFSLKKIELKENVYGNDSLRYYLKLNKYGWAKDLTAKRLIDEYIDVIEKEKKFISEYDSKIDSIDNVVNQDQFGYQLKAFYLKSIISLEKDMREDSLVLSKLSRLYTDSASVICKKYEAVYSIKNPMLNNAEQEITKTFFLTPDGGKVIAAQ